ncbi:MAG: DUF4198 domain-containing protein [gamma proteobacterium symbiont of Taylorina sp.]|nr:DUF4198 domain-containing protein [gamma proteobacterium symbiont of Taylorina sp.]
MRTKLTNVLLILAGVLGMSGLCQAELLWNPKPAEKQQEKQHDQHAGHGQSRNKEKAFYLEDNQNTVVKYIDPALKVLSLTAEDNTSKYILPKTGMDNYHALVAERITDISHESSLRYAYQRGKPSGFSPENLIQLSKLPLEIVPEPMIREHWRFYTNNSHLFQILFDKKPLVDSWVVFQTSNGTILDSKTDANGKVMFKLPDDFKDIKPGRRANQPAEFLLRSVQIDNGITYKTNFSAPYSVNPSHWQSNNGGILALSIGFLAGIMIMRRHNQQINITKAAKKSSRRVS